MVSSCSPQQQQQLAGALAKAISTLDQADAAALILFIDWAMACPGDDSPNPTYTNANCNICSTNSQNNFECGVRQLLETVVGVAKPWSNDIIEGMIKNNIGSLSAATLATLHKTLCSLPQCIPPANTNMGALIASFIGTCPILKSDS